MHNTLSNDTPVPTDESQPVAVHSWSMLVCAVMLVLYAMYFAGALIVPILTSLFGYLTLRPLVRRLRNIAIPASVGAAIIMLGLTGMVAIGTLFVFEPAKQMIERAPQHMVVVKQRLSFILDKVAAFNEATDHMADSRNDSSKNPRDEPVSVEVKQPALTSNLSILSGTGNAMSFFMFTGVLLYFLLASGDDLLGNIMPALPNLRSRIQLLGVIENVQDGLGRYLAQVTAINFCLGVAVSIATWLLGMPSPLVWGVMAMTLNFIPIVGACVGVLVIFFVTLVNFEAAYFAFVVAGVYAALTALEGQLITPSILGRSMEMSPILVFLSIAIWGWMWGLIGVFLSVPILIAARLASEQYESLATMATVLGGRSEATAKGVPQQIFDEDGAEIIAAA